MIGVGHALVARRASGAARPRIVRRLAPPP
ncbi:hypothetical protein M218_10045 [Burkholderia pseudomallei MSHR338]|nr:hypothetical protein M218_10045 [Burkholderia pseudomallei MSHR338]